jgi:hypothetical protein
MSTEERTSNKNSEFLLDVCPNDKEGEFTIYDITSFLPHWQGYERKNILTHLAFTIKGKEFTVMILDYFDCLNEKTAKELAREWYLGNTTYHRLD